MNSMEEGFWIKTFSQSQPIGSEQANIPELLRRVSESIEKLGDIEVMDIIFHNEVDSDGMSYPHLSVYYHSKDDHELSWQANLPL